uniref:RNase H type-1 domain-containing protein n=1 Tax=Manihot esculenta TaxID=3983 RepID=A0A2C9UUN7_MANES
MSPMGPDLFKINFDAAVNRRDNCGITYAIAKDHQLQPRGWSCKKVYVILDLLVLKSLACREALLPTQAKGFYKVNLEGDCQILIKLINGDIVSTLLEIHNILKDVKTLSTTFQDISFSYVPRIFYTTF